MELYAISVMHVIINGLLLKGSLNTIFDKITLVLNHKYLLSRGQFVFAFTFIKNTMPIELSVLNQTHGVLVIFS